MSTTEKKKIVWDEKMTEVFIKICTQEVRDGNRPTTHLNKKGWVKVQEKMKSSTKKELDLKELKNKWDNLKKEWQLWKRLLGKETGLGWNFDKNTIETSDEWWDAKIKEVPAVAKFRDKGLLLPDEMELLFGDVVATGEQAWAPSLGTLPEQRTLNMYLEGSGDSDDSPPVATPDLNVQLSGTISKGKGKRINSTRLVKQKIKPNSMTSVQASLDRLSDMVEAVQKNSEVEGCLTVLDSLNIKDDKKIYCDCVCLLTKKKDARKFLLGLKDPETQLAFLQQMLQ